jgi:hypothetical protein
MMGFMGGILAGAAGDAADPHRDFPEARFQYGSSSIPLFLKEHGGR